MATHVLDEEMKRIGSDEAITQQKFRRGTGWQRLALFVTGIAEIILGVITFVMAVIVLAGNKYDRVGEGIVSSAFIIFAGVTAIVAAIKSRKNICVIAALSSVLACGVAMGTAVLLVNYITYGNRKGRTLSCSIDPDYDPCQGIHQYGAIYKGLLSLSLVESAMGFTTLLLGTYQAAQFA
ncbi:PREDICTED: uncharacterized protein LOC106812486 [Priapulus caudatus]|uniref:Uncharacterized protein LOC106812486 n=1 Tax=Priapulus caudatus TaxID=37621 RepID=A0ABM1EI37_PRICU|nr:PREDICTED: uncharacterized protein LOC106812486 [Priapulus caudatus]XP_014671857.1 PREDICTED: uncharacterized protein LOC106812486 [Priapulus caudatus]XP_014671858.1 PREDICTED: uncharacterized protein LOC106812486 [Priapulus caudatus]